MWYYFFISEYFDGRNGKKNADSALSSIHSVNAVPQQWHRDLNHIPNHSPATHFGQFSFSSLDRQRLDLGRCLRKTPLMNRIGPGPMPRVILLRNMLAPGEARAGL